MPTATTINAYLASLPADRREAITRVRDTVNKNIPKGFEEKIQYGMISWCVPESVLPAKDVYNKQPLCIASLASQKNHMAIYMMGVYGDPKERAWFEKAYKASGKKLDMGQSCVRFKSVDALPLAVIGEAMSHVTVDKYVDTYQRIRAGMKSAKKPAPAKKPAKPATKPAKPAKKRAKKT